MPGIITKIDGIHAILFHVEHLPETQWFYRWRMIGNYPAPYLVWRDATTKARWVKFQVEARGAIIEAEWRASAEDEWSPVPIWEIAPAITGRFAFYCDQAFHTAEPFTVHSPSRGDGVAAYHFGAVTLPAGFETVLEGLADAPVWANVLLSAGEFSPQVPGMRVTNLTPSADWLSEVAPAGPYPLSACPISSARRVFAVGPHSISSSIHS